MGDGTTFGTVTGLEPGSGYDALPRHGCGPGEALPPDTVTEGARLPRKTRAELCAEYRRQLELLVQCSIFNYANIKGIYQALADIAGQIAGMEE